MCGIIGYIGKRNAKDVIIKGLERLEYRGYDSSGIALAASHEDESYILLKSSGKLDALKNRLDPLNLSGERAIGHTRWATHGAPNDQNAHPHKFGRVYVVHNGIVENYSELKDELKALGHSFLSDTDSEVLAHYLDHLITQGKSVLDAIKILAMKIKGASSFGFMIEEERERLYFINNGAPLLVAQGKNETFFASDQIALVDFNVSFYALRENEYGFIERDKLSVFSAEGDAQAITLSRLLASVESIEKNGHKHFMRKEIFEQPEVLDKFFMGKVKNNHINSEALNLKLDNINAVKRIHIVGCGSAYYAGLLAKSYFEAELKIPVDVEIASEYRYRETLTDNETLLIAVSQSGETAETLAACSKGLSLGSHCLAVCNVLGSALVRLVADSVGSIYLHAGPEIAVASTKGFLAQVIALKFLCLSLKKHFGKLNQNQEEDEIKAFLSIKNNIKLVLELDSKIRDMAEEIKNAPHIFFLGRGEMYPVALEGALKMKELSYVCAEGYPAGELKHGPIATVNEGMPAVILFSDEALALKSKSNLLEIKARGALTLAIGPENLTKHMADADRMLIIPNADKSILSILATIALQLLAYHVSDLKGLDVDRPRNLAKSVTVE